MAGKLRYILSYIWFSNSFLPSTGNGAEKPKNVVEKKLVDCIIRVISRDDGMTDYFSTAIKLL